MVGESMTPRTCSTCRWLADCVRDQGAKPTDPICTSYVPNFANREAK